MSVNCKSPTIQVGRALIKSDVHLYCFKAATTNVSYNQTVEGIECMHRAPVLWLFQYRQYYSCLNEQESIWSQSLPGKLAHRFCCSRSCVRQALSNLWNCQPQKIPLHAPPAAPPRLAPGWGFVSLSHCHDATLIGWAPERLGVDLERVDRQFNAAALAQRFFPSEECQVLIDLTTEQLREEVLQRWLSKEAAIKWQCTSLAADLQHWICTDSTTITHRKLGYRLQTLHHSYKNWRAKLALKDTRYTSTLCLV
ncbi:4-phosphopantetheinyl transferase [cyanobiont of Ornithocercus magnificus]|nr:4-phosphopantetheinyl transferase [cyanobiont of Ornithocercus magnificus]